MGTKEFSADYDGVDPQAGGGGITVLPPKDDDGKGIRYVGKICRVEGKVGKTTGNPYVSYDLKVVGGTYNGVEVRYQNVTFLPKDHEYAGIALHALKSLRQPFEGKFKVRPDDWLNKLVYFYVKIEEADKGPRNQVTRLECPPLDVLIDAGEFEGEDDDGIPEWLKEATAAMAGKDAKPAKAAAKAKPAAAANGKAKKDDEVPGPNAVCEVCDVKYKKHEGKKHEFIEAVPF